MTGQPDTTVPTPTMQTTTDNSLNWLLQGLLERTPAHATPWSSPGTASSSAGANT